MSLWGSIVYIFHIVCCVCCMYSTWHTVMDTCTFTYYFILFCSIIQSMFQEFNKKSNSKQTRIPCQVVYRANVKKKNISGYTCNHSSLRIGNETLHSLEVAMGTPSAWPVSEAWNENTQCTWHWQVEAYDVSTWASAGIKGRLCHDGNAETLCELALSLLNL